MFENGYVVMEGSFPIVLSVSKEINIPRIPSLKGKMAAKKAVIKTLDSVAINADVKKCGLEGSPTKVSGLFAVESVKIQNNHLCGDVKEIARTIVKKLSLLGVA
jgi:electron transfer flavoprotein beta subunit